MNELIQELPELLTLAMRAAVEAGDYIASTRPQEIEQKRGGSSAASQVVTEVDHAAQQIILQHLEPTMETYGLAVLTEESEDDQSRHKKMAFWCIDPLDGTLPYVEGHEGYAVCIALVGWDSTPLIGVVYDPVNEVLYHALIGGGAYRNGKPIILKQSSEWMPLVFAHDRSFESDSNREKILTSLKFFAPDLGCSHVDVRRFGGAAINACRILDHAMGCYFKFPKAEQGGGSLWDFAATACLFHESGAIAVNSFGGPLDLNRAGSTFMNHDGILYATDEYLAEKLIGLFYEICDGQRFE